MMFLLLLAMLVSPDSQSPDAKILGLLMKAKYAVTLRDWDYASEMVESALQVNPNSAEAAHLKIQIELLAGGGRPGAAPRSQQTLVLDLLSLMQRFPEDYRFHKIMGNLLVENPPWIKLADLKDADHYLGRAIALMAGREDVSDDELADTYFYLARWYWGKEQSFDAANGFIQAYRHDPDLTLALFYAAESCDSSYLLRSALHYYEKFLEIGGGGPGRSRFSLKLNIAMNRTALDPSPENIQNLIAELRRVNANATVIELTAGRFHRVGLAEVSLQILGLVIEAERESTYYRLYAENMLSLWRYGEVSRAVWAVLARTTHPRDQRILTEIALESALLGGDYQQVLALSKSHGNIKGIEVQAELFGAIATLLGEGNEEPWQKVVNKYKSNDYVAMLADWGDRFGVKTAAIKSILGLLRVRHDWPHALALLEAHFDLAQPPDVILEDFAEILAQTGQHGRAYQIFETLLLKYPNRADLQNNYGYLLADSGVQLEKSKALIERALAENPTASAYLDSMGWVLHKLGDHLAAEKYLRQALGEEMRGAEKLDHLGDVLAAQGRMEEARRYWQMALTMADVNFFRILNKVDPPLNEGGMP